MELHTVLRMDKHSINTGEETDMWRCVFVFSFFFFVTLSRHTSK